MFAKFLLIFSFSFFFFNDTATTEIYTLSLHDALPISHVGLVHVDSVSHTASVIEAHIERGVAVSTADGYLRDKKLRIMVLRLRADLPALIADPLLPHRAASLALERARSGHIAYDFDMDYTDPSRLFCSEVASSVYGELGVSLWTGLSTISAPGLRGWRSACGVRP